MRHNQINIHDDGIWISMPREQEVIHTFTQAILGSGYQMTKQNNNNYGYPYVYDRQSHRLDCRFVDSVFLENPEAWHESQVIVTDNHLLRPVSAQVISVVPEFWHIWHFEPVYKDREPQWAFNCFMNRPRGDRSRTWYELIRRGLLDHGLVSFNVDAGSYQQQFEQTILQNYHSEHEQGRHMVPYNNLAGTLEQCIIDSRTSLILETYVSDDHVVFSEKTFRCLQMPRPWLLYCSPGAVGLLRDHGLDVMDDLVDHSYDNITDNLQRLDCVLDQLSQFSKIIYNDGHYARFQSAMIHNQQLLKSWRHAWPDKLSWALSEITRT